MKSEINKQYLLLDSKPVLVYSLEAFESCEEIDEIIIVAASEELEYLAEEILPKYKLTKVKRLVAGGKERQQSASNGIKAVSQNSEIVLIHDGARPFISQQAIISCINAAKLHGAASAGMPAKDTIKLVDDQDIVLSTPPRSSVWLTQTPQAFKKELIAEAHAAALNQGITATDDAMLLEAMGHKVKMVAAGYENIKITTPEDLLLATQLINIINK